MHIAHHHIVAHAVIGETLHIFTVGFDKVLIGTLLTELLLKSLNDNVVIQIKISLLDVNAHTEVHTKSIRQCIKLGICIGVGAIVVALTVVVVFVATTRGECSHSDYQEKDSLHCE